MYNFEELGSAVMNGRSNIVQELVQKAIDAKVEPTSIINDGLISAMNVVGKRFKSGEMFVPEVLMCAKAMNAGMEVVKPLLVGDDTISRGTIVIGTVKGDLHDIGKNLVGMMFESSGYNVVDLGVDTDPQDFIDAVKEHKAEILCLSALLTTTMPAMKDTIEAVKEAGIRDQVKILVGGAPVTQDYADEIDADGTAQDAAAAVEFVEKLLN